MDPKLFLFHFEFKSLLSDEKLFKFDNIYEYIKISSRKRKSFLHQPQLTHLAACRIFENIFRSSATGKQNYLREKLWVKPS